MSLVLLLSCETILSKEWSRFKRGNIYTIIGVTDQNNLELFDLVTGIQLPSGRYQSKQGISYHLPLNSKIITNQISSPELDYRGFAEFLLGQSYITAIDRLNALVKHPTHGKLYPSEALGDQKILKETTYNHQSKTRNDFFQVDLFQKQFIELVSSIPPVLPHKESLGKLRASLQSLPPEVLRIFQIDIHFNQVAKECHAEYLRMIPYPSKDEVTQLMCNIHPKLADALNGLLCDRLN